jgi:hypothetical protein
MISQDAKSIIEQMKKNSLAVGVISFTEAIVEKITAATGKDLDVYAASGKDVKFHLTDGAGARDVEVINSSDVKVIGMNSAGVLSAASVVSSLTGDVISPADAAHDYLGAHADWILSASEKKAALLVVTNADAGANIIGPAENRRYTVRNASGQAITIKKSGGTGVTIANGKSADVRYSSTVADYVRVTADATH